ncbi:methyltransferase [Streptacidiphilus fuscans]|uniref:Methyltransferase domain-containing protein n=1 Tax=Streptacidiphilus fuscans TaxID=2789292 RepID=A0A931B6S6_9ACTN|nr:methyltransferase [Streptacidiphilus fuscans]MBF9069687.1 methyltransferase domain-containing protein [Streptacidiphilus fuscans]
MESERSRSGHLAALLDSHVVTQIIASAVRFKIPDHLADGTMTEQQLSDVTGIGVPVLRRYLRALQGLGLVEEVGAVGAVGEAGEAGEAGESRAGYRGTALADLLRSDSGSLHGHSLMAGDDYYGAWAELDHALRSGESAYEHRHRRSLWDQLSEQSQVAESFTRTMQWNSERALDEVLGLYDFSAARTVADLGAGHGTLTAGLLRRHPQVRAMVLEQPAVIDHARRSLTEAGLADRCEFLTGDLLREIPRGADLYLLKSVIHNWNDETALRILRNCHAAMGATDRLLVVERVADASNQLDAAIRDLTMLVLFGSQDRSRDEYATLLRDAGFTVTNAVTGPTGFCVLEAAPAR